MSTFWSDVQRGQTAMNCQWVPFIKRAPTCERHAERASFQRSRPLRIDQRRSPRPRFDRERLHRRAITLADCGRSSQLRADANRPRWGVRSLAAIVGRARRADRPDRQPKLASDRTRKDRTRPRRATIRRLAAASAPRGLLTKGQSVLVAAPSDQGGHCLRLVVLEGDRKRVSPANRIELITQRVALAAKIEQAPLILALKLRELGERKRSFFELFGESLALGGQVVKLRGALLEFLKEAVTLRRARQLVRNRAGRARGRVAHARHDRGGDVAARHGSGSRAPLQRQAPQR